MTQKVFADRFWDYNDTITTSVPMRCFICGCDTHRIDICYEAPLHRHCEGVIFDHLAILNDRLGADESEASD